MDTQFIDGHESVEQWSKTSKFKRQYIKETTVNIDNNYEKQ